MQNFGGIFLVLTAQHISQVVYVDDDEDAAADLAGSDGGEDVDGWETDDEPDFSNQDSSEDEEEM